MTTPPNAPEVDVLAPKPRMKPEDNKFHVGNGSNGKHYWLTPPQLLAELSAKHGPFDFDPCPFPKPDDFDGLTCEWGANSYVNPPFGSIMHEGKKKGPTAWARKAIAEAAKGKRVTLVYPIDKWVLMLLAAGARVENLGDVRWLATEDGSAGKGTGRHIACFVLGSPEQDAALLARETALVAEVAGLREDIADRKRVIECKNIDIRERDESLRGWAERAKKAEAERDALAAEVGALRELLAADLEYDAADAAFDGETHRATKDDDAEYDLMCDRLATAKSIRAAAIDAARAEAGHG